MPNPGKCARTDRQWGIAGPSALQETLTLAWRQMQPRARARACARGVPNRSDLRLELDVEKLVAGGCHLAEQDNLVLELFRVHGLRPQLADQAVEVRHVSWAVVWGYKQT